MAALAVLLLAIGAWYLGTRDRPSRSEAARPLAGGEVARARGEVAAPSVTEAGARPARHEAAAADPAPIPGPAAAEPPVPIEPAPERGVPLRVLRGRTDEAVPFAVVTYAEETHRSHRSRAESRARGLDVGDVIDEEGRFYRADGDGVVLVPFPDRHAFVEGWHEGAWGWREIWQGADLDVLTLRLFPDTPIDVLVVRAGERTPVAGVDVGLRYVYGGSSETLATKRTDAAGRTAFRRLRQFSEYYWAHSEEMFVTVAAILAERVQERIDPLDPPGEIVLELPPTAQLEVVVLGPDGTPFASAAVVRVALAGEDALDDWGDTAAAVTVDGRATVEVGLGLDLAIQVATMVRHEETVLEVAGPRVAGDRLVVHVPLGESPPILVGRALDGAGRPLAEETLLARLRAEGLRRRYSETVRTDLEGVFRVPVRKDVGARELISFTLQAGDREDERLEVARELTGPLEPGAHPLGDVTLADLPVIVAGRVVNEEGEPIERAQVVAFAADRTLSASVDFGTVFTRADGSFELREEPFTGKVRLFAMHHAHARSGNRVIDAGDLGVEIRLPSAGRIAGSLVFDEEWLCDFTSVTAYRDGADRSSSALAERPGLFDLGPLKPGKYLVRVACESESEHGVEVPDVEVEAGRTTRDPRLQDVDMRGRIRVLRFDVVDEEGGEIEYGEIHHRSRDVAGWFEDADYVENGEAWMFTQLEEMDLYVTSDGRRSELLPAVREGRTIVLQSGIPVVFTWEGEEPEPKEGVGLRLTYTPTGQDAPRSGDAIHAGREMHLPAAGRYEIEFDVFRIEDDRRTTHLARGTQDVEVRDREEVQEVVLRLPAELRGPLGLDGD